MIFLHLSCHAYEARIVHGLDFVHVTYSLPRLFFQYACLAFVHFFYHSSATICSLSLNKNWLRNDMQLNVLFLATIRNYHSMPLNSAIFTEVTCAKRTHFVGPLNCCTRLVLLP